MADGYCQSKKKDTRKCTPDKVMDYLDAGCPPLNTIAAARPEPPCNCKEQDKKQPNDIPSCEDLVPQCQKQQRKKCPPPQGSQPLKCEKEQLEATEKCQHGYPVCPHGCVLLANERPRKPFIKEFTCKVSDGGLPNPPSGCKPISETKNKPTCGKEGPMPNFCGGQKPTGCTCDKGPKAPGACCKEAQKKKCSE